MSAAPLPGPKLVTTKVRGSIIKVPDATPGLLMIGTNQKQFTLEGVWKSATAPSANQTVDIDLDDAGNITGISVVDPAQLAREKFSEISNKVSGAIGDLTKRGTDAAGTGNAQEILRKIVGRIGVVTLGATALLWVSLFFMTGYKLDLGFIGSQSYSLWDFIGLNMNASLGGAPEVSHGFWGLIGILCILAPLIVPFIGNPLAKFGNALPLVYLAIAILVEKSSINKLLQPAGAPDTGLGFTMQFGGYLTLLCALVLAAMVLKPSRQS
jgi:hypothetical protein